MSLLSPILRILQQRFILCQKLTLSINKIGETFVKYQTVSSFCLHNNRAQMLLAGFLIFTWHLTFSVSLWSPCHNVTMSHLLMCSCHCVVTRTSCQFSLLCRLWLWWSVPGSSLAPTELWVWPPWPGPGTRASAARLLDIRHQAPGASSQTWSHHQEPSGPIMEPRHTQPAAHWRKSESAHPQGSVDKACEDLIQDA